MKTLVVGAGEMGRWFARATGFDCTFTDLDADAATAAAETVGGQITPIDGDESFELVCIAVPIPGVEAAIERHAGRATAGLIDVSGVMGPALAAMDAHASELPHASLHPLFSAANAPGRIPIAVGHDGPAIERVRTALTDAGNDVFDCTAEEHDQAMATIQGAAHAAILSYGLVAEQVPEGFDTPVSAQLDGLVEQVTGGDPRVYADIQAAFDGAAQIADAAEQLADADHEAFIRLYDQAQPSRPQEDDQ